MYNLLPLSLATIALWAPHALAVKYTISNNCGQPINLFANGINQGNLAVGEVTTREYANDWSGALYTDANGGDGLTGQRTTRAGFHNDGDYYYIVIDTERLNTGVRIEPLVPVVRCSASFIPPFMFSRVRQQNNDFCTSAMCDNKACSSVLRAPPEIFPAPSSSPPAPPIRACPGNDVGYK
ncbi:hypothetical protein H0H81_006513, partial [Sphagnurus paluster]